jgi:hypothetical protein
MPRSSGLCICAWLAPLVLACSGGGPTPQPGTPPGAGQTTPVTPGTPPGGGQMPPVTPGSSVFETAYTALVNGQSDKTPALLAAIDTMVQEDPENGRAALYSGFMGLWEMDQGQLSEAELLGTATTTVKRFAVARQLLPNDDRTSGILGLARVKVGKATANSDMVSQGMANLDDGIAVFPAYAHFLRAQATDAAPGNSADFADAISHMFAVLDACREVPDASGVYIYQVGPLDRGRRPCNDEGIVLHVFEGFFLHFGDYLLKAGWTADKVRPIYRSATTSPTFGHWPFASLLQERIDQADQRAALYADGDPTNDPTLFSTSGHECLGCHENTP